jgi:hypothetical protein
MNNYQSDEAAHLIEAFLIENPRPTAADWKRLIDTYPQYASAIADAALTAGDDDIDVADDLAPSADAIFNRTISEVLNLVHSTPSPLLGATKQKIAKIQGPAAREVATSVGLGGYVSLLNGILTGRIVGAKRVLKSLSVYLDEPITCLQAGFHELFKGTIVPAHKATLRSPTVLTKPQSWQAAVDALHLPSKERTRLLELDKD